MNELLISDESVCKIAPATPGLLNTFKYTEGEEFNFY